jgi:hypothetical protein
MEKRKISAEAANAAYLVLWEFLSEGGKVPGINHDLVLEFTDALSSSNTIIIGD